MIDNSKEIHIPVINGDGISDEIVAQMKRVVETALLIEGKNVVWHDLFAGERAVEKYGEPMPIQIIETIRNFGFGIKGPTSTPSGTGHRSVNVYLRKALNLYACVRPCKYYLGVKTRIKDPQQINLVIIRENMEDLYAGIEFNKDTLEAGNLLDLLDVYKLGSDVPHEGSAFSVKFASVEGTRRIMKFAMNYAKDNNRKHIDIITKANIMKFSDGLFLHEAYKEFEENKTEFSDLTVGDLLIDRACMDLVLGPERFDVLVLPNLYGDIISDPAAGIVGGLGFAPGANIGDDCAVFEATHGSWPEGAGQNKANPIALILSAKMMLDYIGEHAAADRIEKAVICCISVYSDTSLGMLGGTKEIGGGVLDFILEHKNLK